ncbi:MAG: hypothetical protein ACE5JB_04485 [bacterium]
MKNIIVCKYIIVFISMSIYSCGIFGRKHDKPELIDRVICPALDVSSTREFINNNNSAQFDHKDSKHPIFNFISSAVKNSFDGHNVIELKQARVQFDFEDESVDAGNLGGFWARWKIILIPFDPEILEEFQKINSELEKFFRLRKIIASLRKNENRIEVELSGPFLSDTDHCEWGDTDGVGTQTLHYSNYGIYDWDFYPDDDRIIGIIYEGDEGVGDDFIAWLDISRTSGEVVIEEAGKFNVVFESMSDVSLSR